MADLESLIRYRQHEVDEKQRILAQLYREAETLEKQKQVILDQMHKEERLAKEMASVEAAAFLGGYLEGARRKIKALDRAALKMETRITIAREDMRSAFSEMKKVEIVQENRNTEEKTRRQHKEEQELDEIAINNYRRRLEEEN